MTVPPVTKKIIDSLHVEAMVLADEARSYFDGFGLDERADLAPLERVVFSCESLKVTTRLMHCVAWLITHRRDGGEDAGMPRARLGRAEDSDPGTTAKLPPEAARIIAATEELYDRVERLDTALRWPASIVPSPVATLHRELERAF